MDKNANMAARYEREIPEGYEARIEGNKVIIELKESEDEMIRKWLIKEIKATHDYDSPTSRKCVDDALAYLERQKEQKLVDSEKNFESIDNAFRRGREVGFREGVESVKQHTGWSEEDERLLTKLMTFVDIECFDRECNGQEVIDWLKSLRPQPHTVTIENATKFGNLEYERGVKDGIQSEKGRHWKPCEEQLLALNYAKAYLCDPGMREEADKLYTDLQKLL